MRPTDKNYYFWHKRWWYFTFPSCNIKLYVLNCVKYDVRIWHDSKNWWSIQHQFVHFLWIKSPCIREILQHLYFSLMLPPLPPYSPLTLAHWKKGSFLPFRVSLWGNLGIIVVLIYPENPANPFFHLDVPELMPKLLSHRDSAAPWLCSVTFFPFHSHTQLCWSCFVHWVFWVYGSHLTTKLRVDLICFHMHNTLTHGITSSQQASLDVLCYCILHLCCKQLRPLGLTVIPFLLQVSIKSAKSLISMNKIQCNAATKANNVIFMVRMQKLLYWHAVKPPCPRLFIQVGYYDPYSCLLLCCDLPWLQ